MWAPAPVPAFATAACLSSTRPSQPTLGAQNTGAPSVRHSRSSSCPGKTEEAVAVLSVFTLVQTACLRLKTLPAEILQKALTYCVWLWPTTRTKKRKMHNGCAAEMRRIPQHDRSLCMHSREFTFATHKHDVYFVQPDVSRSPATMNDNLNTSKDHHGVWITCLLPSKLELQESRFSMAQINKPPLCETGWGWGVCFDRHITHRQTNWLILYFSQ